MRLVINIFIIIHLLLIAAWLFPINTQLLTIKGFFNRYIIFLGLDQNYAMFAPAVRKTNRHLTALITFQDLSTVIWLYPRLERMGFIEAMQKERYRKFANDNIVMPCFKMFLPDFARYIARTHACADNSPQQVSLYLSETDIPGPGQQLGPVTTNMAAVSKEKEPSRITNIFTYQVEETDLQNRY
jgi:hypothetical protein